MRPSWPCRAPSVASLNRQLIDTKMNPAETFLRACYAFDIEKAQTSRIQMSEMEQRMAALRGDLLAMAKAHQREVWKIRSV